MQTFPFGHRVLVLKRDKKPVLRRAQNLFDRLYLPEIDLVGIGWDKNADHLGPGAL